MTQLTTDKSEVLLHAIDSQTAKVGVIGLGYVGLPLIDAYVEAGFQAIGFDVDEAKTEALNQGQSYIAHIKPETIQSWRSKSKFEATTDMQRLDEADVILICVPTPLNESRDPDLKYVEKTAEQIRNCFEGYKKAILATDGTAAVKLVDSKTIEYYGSMRQMAPSPLRSRR